jgi:hypothetical protein
MGAPMARNMAAAGLQVRAWNRTHEKAEGLQRTARDSFARTLRQGHGEEDMAAVYRAVSCTGAPPDGGSLDSAA